MLSKEPINISIIDLFNDHIEFLTMRAIMASAAATDLQWSSIKGNLASQYKFQIDESNFVANLAMDVAVMPITKILKSAKGLKLFVRYDFMRGQDAAVHELLRTNQFGWAELHNSTKYSNVTHRFSYAPGSAGQVTGVILIDADLTNTFIKQWNELRDYSISNMTDTNEYLTKLKEISNEQV